MCSSRSCLSLYVLELRRGAKLYIGISDYISEFLITTWNGWLINEAINTYNVTEVWTRPSTIILRWCNLRSNKFLKLVLQHCYVTNLLSYKYYFHSCNLNFSNFHVASCCKMLQKNWGYLILFFATFRVSTIYYYS